MSLRAAYANIFDQKFNTSGNFTGQIDANIPGNLNVGTAGQTYKIYLNGREFTGGGGGGGGDVARWADNPAVANVDFATKGFSNCTFFNGVDVTIRGNGSNIFLVGSNVGSSFSTDVTSFYGFGTRVGIANTGNNVVAFGSNACSSNAGNNIFAAGLNAAVSNFGSNVIAIGNYAGSRNNGTIYANNIIALGVSAGYNNKGNDVTAIGRGAGYNNSGNYSIFLGTNPNITVSNISDYSFVVYSTDADLPLIYGDMTSKRVAIAGTRFASNYNFTVNGSTYLDGNTIISNVLSTESGVLRVFKDTTFSSNVVIGSNVTVINNISIGGVVSLQSNLNVSGLATISNANIQNNLNVSGLATISNANVQNNLNVSGLATISGANIQSNASVGGTLTVPTVSSLTTLNGTVNFLTPVGAVMLWATNTSPTGWLICDGAQVSRTTYSNLYAVLGGASSPYGQGNGTTTFNVPNLQGRFPIGVNPTYTLASTSGSATYTLTSNNLPVHNHTGTVTLANTTHTHTVTGRTLTHTVNDPGHSHPLSGESGDYNAGQGVASGNQYQLFYNAIQSNTTGITVESHVIPDTATGNNSATPTATVAISNSTNSNNAFSILNPCIALNYIIKF